MWRELRTNYFNNKTFQTLEDVDKHLEYAINDYTQNPETIKQLTQFFNLL